MGSLNRVDWSKSEILYEFVHPLYDRRFDGVRGCRLRGFVPRLVHPIVAAQACEVSNSGASQVWSTHWLARSCRQRFDIDRNRGLCIGRLVRLLLRAGRYERWL